MTEEDGIKKDGLSLWKNAQAAMVLAFISLLLMAVLFVGLRQNLAGVHDEVVRLEQQRIVVLEEKVTRLEQLLLDQAEQKTKTGKP